jgi:hypothetical protein
MIGFHIKVEENRDGWIVKPKSLVDDKKARSVKAIPPVVLHYHSVIPL